MDIILIMRRVCLAMATLIGVTLGEMAAAPHPDDKIAYVFSLSRHGSRAPLRIQPPNYFKVPPKDLSHVGRRERLLTGRQARWRYVE